MYNILDTKEYRIWFEKQSHKEQGQILARIVKIMTQEHFGSTRKLDHNLAELKWKNGRRIYFTFTEDQNVKTIILLVGGNKNSQSKDITKAKKIIKTLMKGI